MKNTKLKPLPTDEIIVGPVSAEQRDQLVNLLNEYRDVFAQDLSKIECAKSAEINITLDKEDTFMYRLL